MLKLTKVGLVMIMFVDRRGGGQLGQSNRNGRSDRKVAGPILFTPILHQRNVGMGGCCGHDLSMRASDARDNRAGA